MRTVHSFIAILLTTIVASTSIAEVVEFPDIFDPWESTAPDYDTLDFTGLDIPGIPSVTNQYHGLGVYFPDWNEILDAGSGYVNDGWGLQGYLLPPGQVHIVFDVPRHALATHFPGCIFIDLYRSGELIHTGIGDCGDAQQGFIGLISEEPFDEAWLIDSDGHPFIDDIYVGVPYIAGDLTGDAWVGPADLGELLASWGPCPPPPPDGDLCLADVFPVEGADGGVGDGTVGAGDLATLLANWSRDCNSNDRADSLDLTLDGDCNSNGIPDDCDVIAGSSEDCNANGAPDECDFILHVPTYLHDDGTQETVFSLNQTDMLWMNSFTVQKGAETVVAVEISWGYGPADIAIWDDPNNDGNPEDAIVLTVVENVPVQFPDHDPFRVIEVPPTFVGEAGEWFFVGAQVNIPGPAGADEYPAGFDESASAGQSWVTAGTVDKFDPPFLMEGAGYPGNWMIRALTEQSGDTDGDGELDACE